MFNSLFISVMVNTASVLILFEHTKYNECVECQGDYFEEN